MQLCTASPDSVFSAQYRLCKELIARMARRCGRAGVRFVLASVPLVHGRDAEASIGARDASFAMDFFRRDLGELAYSSGFAFLPSTIAFSQRENATGERLRWSHWSYVGHRLVGRLMEEAVVVLGRRAGFPSD